MKRNGINLLLKCKFPSFRDLLSLKTTSSNNLQKNALFLKSEDYNSWEFRYFCKRNHIKYLRSGK